MNDSKMAAGPGENQPTMTEYKKSQARVRDLIEKRRMLDRRLVGAIIRLFNIFVIMDG